MTTSDGATSRIRVQIASGASLSDAVDFGPVRPMGVMMPAAWTAAELTFQVSADGITYGDLYEADATEVSVMAAASRYIRLEPSAWAVIRYLKVRSGTSAAPVNQAAQRTFTFLSRII